VFTSVRNSITAVIRLLLIPTADAIRYTFLSYCSPSFIYRFPFPLPSFTYPHPPFTRVKPVPSFNDRRTPVPSHPSSWEPGANEVHGNFCVANKQTGRGGRRAYKPFCTYLKTAEKSAFYSVPEHPPLINSSSHYGYC
jgi:hypothetical protein